MGGKLKISGDYDPDDEVYGLVRQAVTSLPPPLTTILTRRQKSRARARAIARQLQAFHCMVERAATLKRQARRHAEIERRVTQRRHRYVAHAARCIEPDAKQLIFARSASSPWASVETNGLILQVGVEALDGNVVGIAAGGLDLVCVKTRVAPALWYNPRLSCCDGGLPQARRLYRQETGARMNCAQDSLLWRFAGI